MPCVLRKLETSISAFGVCRSLFVLVVRMLAGGATGGSHSIQLIH